MPELPEVETIVRHLKKEIRGKRILEFRSETERLFRDHKDFGEVKNRVVEKTICAIDRLGKNIIFRLSSGDCLTLHLMMTGKILLNPEGERAHDRLRMKLSGNTNLVFNDIRKFGRCRIVSSYEKLGGPDALAITMQGFKNIFAGRKAPIKSVLLNQKLLNGIGNIYSDEMLWFAGINPERKAATLSGKEQEKLYVAMKKVLLIAIKKQGSTLRDYQKPDGTSGGYFTVRKVYRRAGEKCERDGGIIIRRVIGGRSAHFCPVHQE